MKNRVFLLMLLCIVSCSLFAQEKSVAQKEPILGFYHLGMSYEECWEQDDKMAEATAVPDSSAFFSEYLISINGILFNARRVFGKEYIVDIDEESYDKYTGDTPISFFSGKRLFLNRKLVSATIVSQLPDSLNDMFCYSIDMMASFKINKSNKSINDVHNVKMHNQLVDLVDGLVPYLSKKYGKPIKEYNIKKFEPLHKDEYSKTYNEPWFVTCTGSSIMPKAEWKADNMIVVMGITNYGAIFISFIDEIELSHKNLDEVFKPKEPTKPNIEW